MSRIDDLKSQHPQLNISLIDVIASIDPSNTYKYTPFMIKLLKSELESDDVKKEIAEILFDKTFMDYLNRFDKHCIAQRITKNDISSYKTVDEIINAVKQGDEIVKQKEAEKQIIKLYDKDGYMILIPLTYEASKTYGANTKWCITQSSYWNDYQWKYRIIYIIDKNTNKKWAVSRKYDDDSHVKGWTQEDKEISPLMFSLPEDVIMFIMKELKKPQFETELKALGSNSIFLNSGFMRNIKDANKSDLSTFISKFGKFISPELSDSLAKEGVAVSTTTIGGSKPKKKQIDFSDYGDYEGDILNTESTSKILEIMRRLQNQR